MSPAKTEIQLDSGQGWQYTCIKLERVVLAHRFRPLDLIPRSLPKHKSNLCYQCKVDVADDDLPHRVKSVLQDFVVVPAEHCVNGKHYVNGLLSVELFSEESGRWRTALERILA